MAFRYIISYEGAKNTMAKEIHVEPAILWSLSPSKQGALERGEEIEQQILTRSRPRRGALVSLLTGKVTVKAKITGCKQSGALEWTVCSLRRAEAANL